MNTHVIGYPWLVNELGKLPPKIWREFPLPRWVGNLPILGLPVSPKKARQKIGERFPSPEGEGKCGSKTPAEKSARILLLQIGGKRLTGDSSRSPRKDAEQIGEGSASQDGRLFFFKKNRVSQSLVALGLVSPRRVG